jgi:hypothetical protein
MWLLKLVTNVFFLLFGLGLVGCGRRDLKRSVYPKCIGLGEIASGIILGIWSFSIWWAA